MEDIDSETYFKERLQDQIDCYDKKSSANHWWFKRLQFISIVSAASIPLILGYASDEAMYLTFIAGLLGVIVAVITSIIGLFKFQENWLEYRTSCESLRHEKYLFLSKALPYDGEAPFQLLVTRVENLISKENTNWSQYTSTPVKNDKSD